MGYLSDYKVKWRSYESIGAIALKMRKKFGLSNIGVFNIVHLFRRLEGLQFGRSGSLNIKLYKDLPKKAYVTHKPLTLHVDIEIWNEAEEGEPLARFILAHELGHILLHEDYEYRYSSDEASRLKFVQNEESSEWQADSFGEQFLVPNALSTRCKTVLDITTNFDIPELYAQNRLEKLVERRKMFDGEVCSKCQNCTLLRNGSSLKCDTCGGATPCF